MTHIGAFRAPDDAVCQDLFFGFLHSFLDSSGASSLLPVFQGEPDADYDCNDAANQNGIKDDDDEHAVREYHGCSLSLVGWGAKTKRCYRSDFGMTRRVGPVNVGGWENSIHSYRCLGSDLGDGSAFRN